MDQQTRSVAMLAAVGREPDGMGPKGRYPRSKISDGVALWVTAIPTRAENQFGVQFTSVALDRGDRLAPAFARCGFRRRPEASRTVTYYRLLAWSDDGRIEESEAWLLKRAIEGILASAAGSH